VTVNAKNNNSLPNFFKNMGLLFGMDRNNNKTQRDKNIEQESVRINLTKQIDANQRQELTRKQRGRRISLKSERLIESKA
jgi:phage anti-repressor protein